MPPKTPPIPKLRHHRASGQAAVVIAGNWHYLGKHGSVAATELYNRLVAEWLSNGRSPGGAPQLTVNELILAFWRHASTLYVHKNGRPKGELSAIRVAMRPVARLFGSLGVDAFGPRALTTVREELVRAGYCRSIVNDHVRRIRRMFKWATANEMIAPGILEGLRAIDGLRAGQSQAREPRNVRPVPRAFIDAVRPFVSRQVWAMIELQLLCGARPAEIAMLRAADIDMTGKLWEYRPPDHKTLRFGKDRVIFFGPRAQAILRPFLSADRTVYLFSPRAADRERRARLSSERRTKPTPSELARRRARRPGAERTPGEHYTTNTYRQAIWRACDAADARARGAGPPFECQRCRRMYRHLGYLRRHIVCAHGDSLNESAGAERGVPRWSPNQLRHNFATQTRRDFGVEAARLLLGHSSIGTTEIYGERDAALAVAVLEKVG